MLAHELRNPLAPIVNAVQIIRGDATSQSRARWACDVIGRQAAFMTRLLDDLLEVARLVQGKVAIRRERVALAAVIEHALESSSQQLHQRKQAATVELPGEAIEIQGDAARLTQALSNLIGNASKFSDVGASLAVAAAYADGEVRVSVKDPGAGIAPEFLPHIFELFAQGEQPLERPQGGLGVGLTLVKHVVELHAGRVLARSGGLGQGTEVIVHLPAQRVADGPPKKAAAQPATTKGRDAPARRVLVVDDEVASAETLGLLLEIHGFEVRTAHDGAAALEAAQVFLPDVLLLDIGLPRIDGFEVARRLRGSPHSRDALLVALTGYGDAEARSRSAQAGFDVHMTKPADVPRLLRLLADPLSARRVDVAGSP
jgi:CheY-like chemotaxis protein